MWTDTTRAHHARVGLALPTDLTNDEWAVLEPLLPPPSSVGRPRKWPLRRIIEAILYLLRGGLPWRMLPPSFPPVSTVRRWFYLWRDNGLWLSLNHILLMAVREGQGREASPSAGVIDSQSVKTTESGGPRGYDAGKKIKGRKRHIQAATGRAADAIKNITGTIEAVSVANSTIASAVEQQSGATHEIIRAVNQASMGTNEVSNTIAGVAQAAEQTGDAAAQVLSSSSELAQQAARLSHEMDKFLSTVRAA